MKRKEFLHLSVPAFLLLANGNVVRANQYLLSEGHKRKVKLRFVVASDGHYGQPNTEYENFFATLTTRINEEHRQNPFAFCVVNGDIIHDDKTHFPAAKAALDKLAVKYYVSQGNHDHVNAEEWEAIWKMPVNLDFKIKKKFFSCCNHFQRKGNLFMPGCQLVPAKAGRTPGAGKYFHFCSYQSRQAYQTCGRLPGTI